MKALITVSLVAALLAAGPALAHGDAKPQHGGVVASGGDLSFELTSEASGVAVYVVDHGKPADASKMGGKLTVLNGTQKSEAELKPAGANKLVATGVKLDKGAKAVAAIQTAAGKSVTARFTVK
jgi:hypothetical protein